MCDTDEKLSEKHKQVIDLYFSEIDEKLTDVGKRIKAYSTVYTRASENSARTESFKLFQNLSKTQYFSQKLTEQKRIAEEKFQINREWLLEQRKKVYESAMLGDVDKDGNVRLDRSAANTALDGLTKMIGEYAETKLKLMGTGDNGQVQFVINTNKQMTNG